MTIAFDKVPRFLYFNENGEGCGSVFLDGQRIKGIQKVKVNSRTRTEKVEFDTFQYSVERIDEKTHDSQTIGNIKSDLTVGVKVMDFEPFKNAIEIMEQYINDDRIPEEIRKEFADKILNNVEEK